MFISGEHSWGNANAWEHLCVTSQTPLPPSQANMSKQLPEKPVKSSKKKLRNSLLNPNTKPRRFQTTSTRQVMCCF